MASKIPVHVDNRSANAANPEAAVQASKQRKIQNVLSRKKPAMRVPKGCDAELHEQNLALQASNEELTRNFSQSKEQVIHLEGQCTALQQENMEIRKQLDSCCLLLLAGNVDPVLGQRVAEITKQNEDQQKDVMNAAADLLGELKTFGEMALGHRQQLQVQETMRVLKSSQEQHCEERKGFSLEVEEMERALDDAEALLQDI
ncbi:uncharacterized protein LOC125723812 isoform X3 [Brienomyrus brachyistius]|uniref:uncharacterized protein LOC125720898 isoform X3 n=1 Tax=Brienomyrus brachyistius TaxID=42636 RepID=UPI0020B33B1C|nr:uncharacterized protein LOC125720898 isoform X3 [Brienomyrus brachyistius]XP_048856569.1 uncharacterized protein LOC125723812 isoform X3 [Brienomyrus brachyistius]